MLHSLLQIAANSIVSAMVGNLFALLKKIQSPSNAFVTA